jgi:hypothetical protein
MNTVEPLSANSPTAQAFSGAVEPKLRIHRDGRLSYRDPARRWTRYTTKSRPKSFSRRVNSSDAVPFETVSADRAPTAGASGDSRQFGNVSENRWQMRCEATGLPDGEKEVSQVRDNSFFKKQGIREATTNK